MWFMEDRFLSKFALCPKFSVSSRDSIGMPSLFMMNKIAGIVMLQLKREKNLSHCITLHFLLKFYCIYLFSLVIFLLLFLFVCLFVFFMN